jgi:hypothetical protein
MAWWDDLSEGVNAGLSPYGLNPHDWDLEYSPEVAHQRPVTDAYHPGLRGVLERFGPIAAAGLTPLLSRDHSPIAQSLAFMARAGADYLDKGVDLRARGIEDQNTAARQQTEERNTSRRQVVQGNREAYRKTFLERMTPRQVVEQAAKDKADAARGESKAREEGVIQARKAAGLRPPGAPAPAPKPKTPPREPAIGAFRLFGPGDEIAVKGLRDELDRMRTDFKTKAAFEEPRKLSNGKTAPDPIPVQTARARITVINRQIHEATKGALMGRLDELSYDVESSPKRAKKRLAEIHNAAKASGLANDPEYMAQAEARAQEILDAIDGGEK